MKRRIAAVATVIVAALAAAVVAAGGNDLTANPTIAVIEQQLPAATSARMIALTNPGTTAVTVDHFTSACTGITISPAGFTIPAGGMHAVTVTCPAATLPGMNRCLFHARDAADGNLVDFMAVCEAYKASLLAASPAMVMFPATMVGSSNTSSFQLSNTGAGTIMVLDLQLDDLAGNFVIGMPCPTDAIFCDAPGQFVGAGSSATVTVRCTPQSPGMKTANLYIATTDTQGYRLPTPVTLQCAGSGTTDPVFSVSPLSVDLLPVEVVGGVGSATVHITNAGGGTVHVTDVRIVDAGVPGASVDWTYVAASDHCTGQIPPACDLTPTDALDLQITFDPSAIGSRNASLLIGYEDTSTRSIAIPLNATGRGATLAVLGPSPIDVGQVPIGHTSTVKLHVANNGNRDLANVTAQAMPAGPIAVTPATIASVTPTMPVELDVECKPTATGPVTAMIHIASTDASTGSPVDVMATCSGIDTSLFATPSTIDLGEVRTMTMPADVSIMLASVDLPLTVNPPQLDAPDSNLSLTPLTQMTTPAMFALHVEPGADETIANHIVVSDTANEMLQIPVTGKIVTASFAVPPTVKLGTFCVGSPTTSSAVALESTGTATIGLPVAPKLASTPSPFDLALTSPQAYPAMLAVGSAAIVEITPKRVGFEVVQTDALDWATDVAGGQAPQTTVTASFVMNGGALAPGSLDFGQVPIHLVSNDMRVTLQNCNPTQLDLDQITTDGPFRTLSPPMSLAPNETVTFSVEFQPVAIGPADGRVTIKSMELAMDLVLELHGIGVTGGGDGDGGSGDDLSHTSFYACSCRSNDPAGGIVVIAAIGYALRRRRRATTTSASAIGQPPNGPPELHAQA
jgi:hypothetical protein